MAQRRRRHRWQAHVAADSLVVVTAHYARERHSGAPAFSSRMLRIAERPLSCATGLLARDEPWHFRPRSPPSDDDPGGIGMRPRLPRLYYRAAGDGVAQSAL